MVKVQQHGDRATCSSPDIFTGGDGSLSSQLDHPAVRYILKETLWVMRRRLTKQLMGLNEKVDFWQRSHHINTDHVLSIRYECEDRWSCFGLCVISNPDLLSSSETGINPGIRSWKKRLSQWAQGQKAIVGIYIKKKWRAETLQPGLEFDNLKPRLKSGIFKCIFWLNGSFFGSDYRSFLKEEVKTYLTAPIYHFSNRQRFLSLHHVYSLLCYDIFTDDCFISKFFPIRENK